MAATIRSVNILIRDDQGKTLLQMRDGAARTAPLMWSLWGGAVEEYDNGPHETASRELGEELGILAKPSDFTILARRESTTQIALLMEYAPRVRWGGFHVHEGAGAGFFWREEIKRLAVSPSVRHHLDRHAEFFFSPPSPGR